MTVELLCSAVAVIYGLRACLVWKMQKRRQSTMWIVDECLRGAVDDDAWDEANGERTQRQGFEIWVLDRKKYIKAIKKIYWIVCKPIMSKIYRLLFQRRRGKRRE